MPSDSSRFMYRLTVLANRVEEYDFQTAADAAWAVDKARLLLAPFLRRSREFNFPDRIAAISEGEMTNPSAVLLDWYIKLSKSYPHMLGRGAPELKSEVITPAIPAAVAPPPTHDEQIDELTRKQSDLVEARGIVALVKEMLAKAHEIADEHGIRYRKINLPLEDLEDRCRLASLDLTDEINALKSQQLSYGKIEGSTPL